MNLQCLIHLHLQIIYFDPNCVMTILEVKWITTNTALDITIKNCINDLFLNANIVNMFLKKDFKGLLKLTTYAFVFDNEYYRK